MNNKSSRKSLNQYKSKIDLKNKGQEVERNK